MGFSSVPFVGFSPGGTRRECRFFPSVRSTHVRGAAGQARSPRPRARAARPMGAGGYLRCAAGSERRRAEMVVRRRAGDREQVARRPHGVGPDAQGRLPALQGAPWLRPALPERLRLSGPLDRGRRRARARAELEARDRGVRPRGVRAPVPRGGRQVVLGADARLHPARAVDGLGKRLLHVQRHEHRVHLEVPQAAERAGPALSRPPFDRVVPTMRDVALPAQADAGRRVPGEDRPVAFRAAAVARPRPRMARRLDDDAVDAPGERRRGGEARRGVRAARKRRVGSREPLSGRALRRPQARRRARRLALPRAVRRPRARELGRARGDPVGRGVPHRRHRDRAHRPGLRPRGLRAVARARPARADAGRFYDDYGWLHGLTTTDAADQIVGRLGETGFLVAAGTYEHRYPHCWRCDTPLISRLSDDWFISVDELRPELLAANATVDWVPAYMGKRMDDWLRNMGDWNISRRRYYGLPLPFYPCRCGHLNVVGSKAELEQRALEGFEQLEELRRPWVDRVPITCEQCGERVERIPEVGDVWLDAGIVPFSTLGWENPTTIPEGYATGASRGLSHADLPDHAYWEEWLPADWVSEMREQIRLWFYSQLFMSVALIGKAPFTRVLGYEKMLDEHGREMHGSWGNM